MVCCGRGIFTGCGWRRIWWCFPPAVTALGKEVRGEGLVGLADGFFAAGARHLVVSLWDVNDRATAELMARFYHHLLLAGRPAADALRLAQRQLRDETQWRSPAHWAGFVAVGDWRVGGFVTPEDGEGFVGKD